jgi:hypothetical protein
LNNKLFIPGKIKVGYNNRSDTYTGKLAYVIYYDNKGKLRKEQSWESWRDKKIEPDEYTNEPTSGFVLNKKVGDYKWGWNHRRSMVRVLDPRGFEIEITVPNLLFILEECSSIKGKGLEGEFVYAIDGKELLLLPITSQEYVDSSDYTSLQDKKITKKDMVPGCWYKNKKDKLYLYLGRENYYDYSWYHKSFSCKKYHIFVSETGSIWTQPGFTSLAERVTIDIDPEFPNKYDKFKNSENGSKPQKLVIKPSKLDLKQYMYRNMYFRTKDGDYYCGHVSYFRENKEITAEFKIIINSYDIDGKLDINLQNVRNSYTYKYMTFNLSEIEPVTFNVINENGTEWEL